MGWVFNVTPRPLYPRERPGTSCIGGWVSPRAGLDGCGKTRPPPGFDPRTVQPVASRWAIPAHVLNNNNNNNNNNYSNKNETIPRKRIIFGELEFSHLLKNFQEFYKRWKFITDFICTQHLSVSWTIRIQSTQVHTLFKSYFNVILIFTLSFFFEFPHRNSVGISLLPLCAVYFNRFS